MSLIKKTKIDDVLVITPVRFSDDRGYFSETYNERALGKEGFFEKFAQDNHSMSNRKGTIRGLHYQAPGAAQAKLVRVTRGSVLDVAVDIRKGSPTFGHHVKELLSAENGAQLFVPVGFLHGFITLEDNTEVQYKVTDFYSAEHDGAVLWNSPELGIDWETDPKNVVLSEKDGNAEPWSAFSSPF